MRSPLVHRVTPGVRPRGRILEAIWPDTWRLTSALEPGDVDPTVVGVTWPATVGPEPSESGVDPDDELVFWVGEDEGDVPPDDVPVTEGTWPFWAATSTAAADV